MIQAIAGLPIGDVWEGLAGENLAKHDLCRVGSDSKFYKASATSTDTMPGLVISLGDVIAGGAGQFLRRGKITNNAWAFTVGQQVHAGLEPGGLMQEFPGSRQQLQIVGIPTAANQLDFDPQLILIEVA